MITCLTEPNINNDELIAHYVNPLFPIDDCLDVTYGRGLWWKLHMPAKFASHDLAIDGVDFRRLPEESDSVGQVALDPPYMPIGGRRTKSPSVTEFNDRFGLVGAPTSPALLRALYAEGMTEAMRVLRPGGFLIVKSTNYTSSGKHQPQSFWVMSDAEALGYKPLATYIHNSGTGPQPPGRGGVKTPRLNYSMLMLLGKPLRYGRLRRTHQPV